MAEKEKITTIVTTLASGNAGCKKVIDDLLHGLAIDTGVRDEEDWEVRGKMIRYVIAEGALEQWIRLDKSVPNEDYYGRGSKKRIIDALVSGGIPLEQPLSNLQSKLVASKVLEEIVNTMNEKRFLCASSSIIRSLDPKPQDLETFILSVLHSFKPMPIRAEEDEFYRAATAILPSGMDIIRGENTTFGKVDFYVHTQDKKVKWCIDLVREGDLLDEHVQKFEKRDEGEQLSDKPSKKGADCDDYMILDFREAGKIGVDKEKAKSYAKVWFAKYSKAFTSISVSGFEPTTSKLVAIKTIKLPKDGHEQCSAFESLKRKLIQKCADINDTVEKFSLHECISLEDNHVNAVMGLIKKQFPGLAGLHNCLIGLSHRSFPKTEGDFIQIIHVNGYHWITVQHDTQLDIINIYDSMFNSIFDVPGAKLQIAALLGTKKITLKFHKTQYQNKHDSSNCGVFAVAFATDLAYGRNPSKHLYNQDLLRSHFRKCLCEQKMTPFPSTDKKPGKPNTECIEVMCTCSLPANGESMVQCIECKELYHSSCKADIIPALPRTCTT